MLEFKSKIGLEVHVQLDTKTKMFCRCRADNNMKDPNTLLCPVCLGLPGALPVLNKKAVELAAKMSMVINCEIQNISRFDRKNYFYPDLPKGYQITQFFEPIALNGKLVINNEGKEVDITRLHLEEDTAKLTHAGKDSLIDYNRSGIPLMEIVSEPDIETPEQAKSYLKKIHELLVWNNISKARMQLGEMRCDANISLLNDKDEQLGEVVEIKNMNSFKNVEKALAYEYIRQIEAFKNNEDIVKETRGFDVKTGETYSQRTKEHAHDYRYFPEPDVPTIVLSDDLIEKWKNEMPKSGENLKDDLIEKYGINDSVVNDMVKNTDSIEMFEELYDKTYDSNELAKLVLYIIYPELKRKDVLFEEYNLDDIKVLSNYYLNKKINKAQFIQLWEKNIVEKNKIENIDLFVEKTSGIGDEKITELFDVFVKENPDQINIYKEVPEKKIAVENFFIGYVKRNLNGGGDIEKIKSIFNKKIDNL